MSKSLEFRTPYKGNERVQYSTVGPSLTDQSFKQDCDIGFIIENFVRTGELPQSTMSYVDCTTVPKYEEAMQIVAEANSNFEQLPAKIRDEFKTVSNYLEYISNPDNLLDSYNRGLIDRSTVDPEDIIKLTAKPPVSSSEGTITEGGSSSEEGSSDKQ